MNCSYAFFFCKLHLSILTSQDIRTHDVIISIHQSIFQTYPNCFDWHFFKSMKTCWIQNFFYGWALSLIVLGCPWLPQEPSEKKAKAGKKPAAEALFNYFGGDTQRNACQWLDQMHSVEHRHVNIHFVATRWGNEWGILLGIGGCKTLRFANICWHVRT